MITSRHNPVYKELNGLHSRQGREGNQLFLIEGVRLIEEALAAGLGITTLVYSQHLLRTRRGEACLESMQARGVDVREIDDRLLCQLARTERPQGILAAVRQPALEMSGLLSRGDRLRVLVVDRVQDPGNLGTLLRTAEAFDWHAVITTKGTVDLYNDKTIRSAMGSLFRLPHAQGLESMSLLQDLQAARLQIIATALHEAQPFHRASYSSRCALVVGNEGAGVDPVWLNAADTKVTIPIPGPAESLNVGVAAGIVMARITLD